MSSATFPAASDFVEKLGQYNCLPKQAGDVLWNFEKFLIGRDGRNHCVDQRPWLGEEHVAGAGERHAPARLDAIGRLIEACVDVLRPALRT